MSESTIVIRPLRGDEVDLVVTRLGLARLHSPGGSYLVAWDGDVPVGHVHLTDHATPHLQDVEVHPDAQRRGIARLLVREAARTATERGAPALELSVGTANEGAQALYRSLGFVETGDPPRRVSGTIQIRSGPIEVDEYLVRWQLILPISGDGGEGRT